MIFCFKLILWQGWMARQREPSCPTERLRLHNLRIGETGSRIVERLHNSGWQWCKLRKLLFQNLIETHQSQRGKMAAGLNWFVFVFGKLFHAIWFDLIEGRSHSLDHRWFQLCDSNVTKIGREKNGVRWCFAWQIDGRWIGKDHERFIRWCCLCG